MSRKITSLSPVKCLLYQIYTNGSADPKLGIVVTLCAPSTDKITKFAKVLVLSQENIPGTHRTV